MSLSLRQRSGYVCIRYAKKSVVKKKNLERSWNQSQVIAFHCSLRRRRKNVKQLSYMTWPKRYGTRGNGRCESGAVRCALLLRALARSNWNLIWSLHFVPPEPSPRRKSVPLLGVAQRYAWASDAAPGGRQPMACPLALQPEGLQLGGDSVAARVSLGNKDLPGSE